MGDYIYYKIDETKKILCQVTSATSTPTMGCSGRFQIVNYPAVLPKIWDNLYKAVVTVTGQIEVGLTDNNEPVKFRLNAFFKHILVGGKTGKGKTHVQIKMHETLVDIKVPSFIIDTQGEFIHLPEYNPNAILVEDITLDELIEHLKQRHTVILNLAGLPVKEKTRKVRVLCDGLFDAKEKDYKNAKGDKKLLQLPPVIVDFDEAEVYAPSDKVKNIDRNCKDSVVNMAKRGGKLGIGCIFNSQRLPALHYDARSQCGSALIFQITDGGSRTVLSQMPFITAIDLDRTKNFTKGVCLVTGEVVEYPLIVEVHDIRTQRAKDLDFETQLGIEPTVKIQVDENEDAITAFQMDKALTYASLEKQFRSAMLPKMPQLGVGLIVPEARFRQDWVNTLKAQGLDVRHFPNLPGGAIYFVSKKLDKSSPILKMKPTPIPDTPAIQVQISKTKAEPPPKHEKHEEPTGQALFKNLGPCSICGLPKEQCICGKLGLGNRK